MTYSRVPESRERERDRLITTPKAGMMPTSPIFQSSTNERAWLKKHGKERYIDFDDKEIRELRVYFDSLDEDGSGGLAG